MLSINGINLDKKHDLMIITNIKDDTTFDFDSNYIEIMGNPITYKGKDRIKPRRIKVELHFIHQEHIPIENMLEEINDFFFDIYGQRKQAKVEIDYWQGKYVWAILEKPIDTDHQRMKTKIDIELICLDPFKYSNKITTQTGQFGSTNITWGSTTVTFNDPYTFGYTVSSDTEPTIIEVPGGNVVSYPKITIKGSADYLVLYCNNKKIVIGQFTNSTIEINRFISYVNGKESFINAVNFALAPGNNRVFVTGTNIDVTITFEIQEVYR